MKTFEEFLSEQQAGREFEYTIANVKGDIRNVKGAFSCDLLEDGIAIAKVKKKANESYVDTTFKFYTDRARSRFDNWCGEISMGEAIEALGGGSHRLKK